jgi:hypothetical protein
MLVSGIKSRPVYSGLVIDPYARRHVFALAGEGALALLKKPELRDADICTRAEILYVPEGSNHAAALQACGITNCWQAPTIPTLLTRLGVMLSTAHMGLRLYTSGTEGFMGQVIQVAIDAGITHSSIRTEHQGSQARRISCVHCKGITENVTTNPVTCSHCGLTLLVRDHYSRRIGAFQGVCIDAEVPGDVPPTEELFK